MNTGEIMVRGRRIPLLMHRNDPTWVAKAARIGSFLERLPSAHLSCIPPCVVMLHKPGGRDGGGTWSAQEWRSTFATAGGQRNTGIAFGDLQAALGPTFFGGIIGMSEDRWSGSHPVSTFLHEVGHCVHREFGLVPRGASASDFPGMQSHKCGAGNPLERLAVEAYARRYTSPAQIYHVLPAGQNARSVNATLVATLDRSAAYAGINRDH